MTKKSRLDPKVINFIIQEIESHPKDIVTRTAEHFKMSRISAHRYLKRLITNDVLIAKGGATSSRVYELNDFIDESFSFSVNKEMQEDKVWRDKIAPFFLDIKKNIVGICYYGVTEMINNVIDHSESSNLTISLRRNAKRILISIKDSGVGIFEKIRTKCQLDDPRHALLELSKGKLTTDPKHHTGEGVFFTSRMFDEFSISSKGLYYRRFLKEDDDWLIEVEDQLSAPGTSIILSINLDTDRTTVEVFNKFTESDDDHRFAYTHVPVSLARYGDEQLVSRSQAKRVLARFEKFSEVMLDFQGVQQIGRAFADEIFRVFRNEHPEIKILHINTTPQIDGMIKSVRQTK